MDTSQNSDTNNQSAKSSHQRRWVWVYFGTLFFLLLWGVIQTEVFPFFSRQVLEFDQVDMESIAPGAGRFIQTILLPWVRWDTFWYLGIAKSGYAFNLTSVAYPPLYPFLSRIVGRLLGGQYLIGSLLVSWISLFGACILMVDRARNKFGEKAAEKVILRMLLFPTAFFFFAGYTESLFLFLVLLSWRMAESKKWWAVGVLGAVAILTRFTGLFLAFAYAFIWLKQYQQREIKFASAFWLMPMPVVYFGWSWLAGRLYGVSPAQSLWGGWKLQYSLPWMGIIGNLKMIFTQPVSKEFIVYFIDLLAVAVTVWVIFDLLRRREFPESAYLIALLLVSIMKISETGLLISTARYVLPLFPVYLYQPKRHTGPLWDRVVVAGSAVMWIFCSAMFFTSNWIG